MGDDHLTMLNKLSQLQIISVYFSLCFLLPCILVEAAETNPTISNPVFEGFVEPFINKVLEETGVPPELKPIFVIGIKDVAQNGKSSTPAQFVSALLEYFREFPSLQATCLMESFAPVAYVAMTVVIIGGTLGTTAYYSKQIDQEKNLDQTILKLQKEWDTIEKKLKSYKTLSEAERDSILEDYELFADKFTKSIIYNSNLQARLVALGFTTTGVVSIIGVGTAYVVGALTTGPFAFIILAAGITAIACGRYLSYKIDSEEAEHHLNNDACRELDIMKGDCEVRKKRNSQLNCSTFSNAYGKYCNTGRWLFWLD